MDEQEKRALLKQMTWPVIEQWAGATIAARGQSYTSSGQIAGLAQTSRGEIIAWVQGTQRYATLVDIDEHGLAALCTCPYEDVCKHAVAVVLAYREQLQRQLALPTVPDSDPRLLLLEGVAGDDRETIGAAGMVAPGSQTAAPLHEFLEHQTQASLVEILEELAGRFPDVHAALEARRKLASGTAEQLVGDVRQLIISTSVEPAWRNEWDGEGSTPDYGPVRDRLELLLRQGYADEVVDLGETLLEAGKEQIEQSHDQGETAGEIGECMRIVFGALTRSTLEPSEQILWVIDALLRDDYGLCDGAEIVLEQPYSTDDWSGVADELLQRLRDRPASPGRQNFSTAYGREQVSNWAIRALQSADRAGDVIPLAEREAELNGDYVRLVKLLIAAGRLVDAEHWIARGIAALGQAQLGTTRELRDTLRTLREQAGDWSRVAAMRAEDFLDQPTMLTLITLRGAAERAGVWPAVGTAAMHYLETGEPPVATERTSRNHQIPAWPLPATDLPQPAQRRQMQFPNISLLIEIAAGEKQPEQVLYWYDRRPAMPGGWHGIDERIVAEAIGDAYPDRAIKIWKKLIEAQIAQTQPKVYEIAVGYLRMLGDLLTRKNRDGEWWQYVAELRQTNARKRRLIEMLDMLSRQDTRKRRDAETQGRRE